MDSQALALAVIGWVVSEEARAERLLSLTGLTPAGLRAGLGDRSVLAAGLDFLASHEPDLLAAADALGVTPEALVAAREELTR